MREYNGKIINIHPSLLPKYGGKGMYGLNVHKAVFENKEKESGAVHFVNGTVNIGKFFICKGLYRLKASSPEEMQKIVLKCIEHRILKAILKLE